MTVPEIWPGQNRGGKKRKKKEKEKKKMNASKPYSVPLRGSLTTAFVMHRLASQQGMCAGCLLLVNSQAISLWEGMRDLGGWFLSPYQ